MAEQAAFEHVREDAQPTRDVVRRVQAPFRSGVAVGRVGEQREQLIERDAALGSLVGHVVSPVGVWLAKLCVTATHAGKRKFQWGANTTSTPRASWSMVRMAA